MIQLFNILKRQYQTLNLIQISHDALTHNYHHLSSLDQNLKVAPVLKSNAYGHGITEAAKVLDSLGAPFFCVDSLYEAYELLKAHIKTPILIMGYTHPNNFKVKKLPFSYAVYDLQMAQVLNNYQWDAKIHIKIDTGMHRLGVPLEELSAFLQELKKLPNLKVEGVMSHLASASNTQDTLYQTQVKNFKQALKIIRKSGFDPKWVHLSASAGLLNPQIRKELSKFSNMARCGLSVYGISPNKESSHLKPALKLTTKIAQIKKLKKGDKIGYDGTYTAKKELILGVLPIGYFDGVDRRLSNQGAFLVEGVKCPIVGRVSMNITTIDLSKMTY
ncbi:MAG: Alanine racemase [Candidatus Daviesbacteria bacterium GW2011_GWA2_40_9]|uniref:Alanine racemase n=1 Tax=Candidatus Daviesbacteria bacterium GW2011_GWA2_40_9 TaxID=1618424 RepID=A0A0G0WHQ9_9BACT|nr:MAG: Alanine racemase [Candidatus Daviesbacteria bacterium GW2011_GWA2_40_9]